MTVRTASAFAGALLSLASLSSAFAAPMLVYVSTRGTDAPGCGTLASPCRTLQFAHDHVDAGGYIVAIDPADYGSLIVHKPVNILNESTGAAVVSPGLSSVAFVIDEAVVGTVRLQGFTLRGNVGVANSTGILFGGNGRLEISDCVIHGFSNSGVRVQGPAKALIIANSSVSNNVGVGIKLESLTPGPQISAFLDNVRVANHVVGILSTSTPGQSILWSTGAC